MSMHISVLTGLTMLFLCGCMEGNRPVEKKVSPRVMHVSVPTIDVYTLGQVQSKVRVMVMDSLRKHYPRCRFVRNLSLPRWAVTTKRHDHVRYRADLLNHYLLPLKTRGNMVVGLTSADIGLDNFRGQPHYGIRGLANGFNSGLAVFSDCRGNRNELFRLMKHEIAHAFGLLHCPNATCIMQDQKGGNLLKTSPGFCPRCAAFMAQKGWR